MASEWIPCCIGSAARGRHHCTCTEKSLKGRVADLEEKVAELQEMVAALKERSRR